jgi:hypothetical protein
LDSKKRELIIKYEMIKLPELILDVGGCGYHFVIANLRPRSALLPVAL